MPEGPNQPASTAIRVLCVDDHPLILEGVAAMLATEAGMELIGQATNGHEAIDRFVELKPHVTLMDLVMPAMGGLEAIRQIRGIDPGARVIALTTYKGDEDIHRALKAGACGYLLKDAMRRELIHCIRQAHAGRNYLAPEAAQELAASTPHIEITGREREVLKHMAEGLRNKEIAAELRISEETVKFHVRGILGKLGVRDRTHAVTLAFRRGILHLD